ncbi:MAG: ATP-binding cassette domain-containing protein [Acholeplasmataceae bacterium]|jgi:ABC-type lipoprotein export system ATPase subunit/ABC-type antimicrobial peptide transport system permease subunit|nr:ATP-binding cassette domain-containing protein [Acholeplasmataceae bacterium]
MIQLVDVTKQFNSNKKTITLFKDVTYSFPEKGIVILHGKSGVGKTTLLNLISKYDENYEGTILFKSKDLKAINSDDYRLNHIGFIFQEFHLLEDLSVIENIALSAEIKGVSKDTAINKSELLLREMGMQTIQNQKVNTLSGGEKQRVSFLRAIIKQPDLIIADEPTGNLDDYNTQMILNLLKLYAKDNLVIMVTHESSIIQQLNCETVEIYEMSLISNQQHESSLVYDNAKLIKPKTPITLLFNLALNSFKAMKFKFFVSTLILWLSFMLFGLVFYLATYPQAQIAANAFINSDNASFRLNLETNVCGISEIWGGCYENSLPIRDIEIEKLSQIDNDIYINKVIPKQNIQVPGQEKSQLDDLYESIVVIGRNVNSLPIYSGEYPSSENEILLTDYLFDQLFPEQNNIFIQNISVNLNGVNYIISGIVKTNYEHYNLISFSEPYTENRLYTDIMYNLGTVYITVDGLSYLSRNTNAFTVRNRINKFTPRFNTFFNASTFNPSILYGKTPENRNEVILPTTVGVYSETEYNNMLNTQITIEFSLPSTYSYPFTPDKSYTVVGFYVPEEHTGIVIHNDEFSSYFTNSFDPSQVDVIFSKNASVLTEFLDLVGESNYKHASAISPTLHFVTEVFSSLRNVLLGITMSFSFLSSLILISYFNHSLKLRRKEIGILKSLGVSRNRISIVFVIEGIIISFAAYFLSILFIYRLFAYINELFKSEFETSINIFSLNVYLISSIFIYAAIIIFISSIAPVRKLLKLNSIDIIRI